VEGRCKNRDWLTGELRVQTSFPGTYRLSIGLTVESAKIEGKSCRLPGFVMGLSIGGTDQSGRDVTLMTATSKVFKARAGDRITKNIKFSCS
jgi:hypothetical protein